MSLTLAGAAEVLDARCYDNGVIHSFWIPELNGKKDVVPGRTQFLTLEADKPGTFLGQCAEYCGLSHANMRMRVIAQTRADYDAWVQSQQRPGRPKARRSRRRQQRAVGLRELPQLRAEEVRAPSARTSRTLADRRRSRATSTRLNYDNLWKWVYDAPRRKPMGNLQQHMPNFRHADRHGMTRTKRRQIAVLLADRTPPPARAAARGVCRR